MTLHRRARRGALGLTTVLALGAAMALALVLPVAASAAGGGATTVRGTQLAAGTCEAGGYAMTGSLDGCWWILTFDSKTDPGKHNYRATGTELFDGCLGSVCGTFSTRFEFTAKTDGPWAAGSAEIHGRCHQPITGGTGGFAGASGEISFHDVVDVTPNFYPYWGSVHLAKSADAGAAIARLFAAPTAQATC